MREKPKTSKTCGDKRIYTRILIVVIATIMILPAVQANIQGEVTLTEEEIYQKDSTNLEVRIENLRQSSIENTELTIKSPPLEIDEEIPIGSIERGESWTKQMKIKTWKETPTGSHEIKTQLFYNQESMQLRTVNLNVRENPLKLETTLQKGRIEPREDNKLILELTNKGEQILEEVNVNAKFDQLEYINTKEDCSRYYGEMKPGEKFETTCSFQATEDAGRTTELEIETSFRDLDQKTHRFTEYVEINVSTTMLSRLETILVIAIAVVILLMFFKATM